MTFRSEIYFSSSKFQKRSRVSQWPNQYFDLRMNILGITFSSTIYYQEKSFISVREIMLGIVTKVNLS